MGATSAQVGENRGTSSAREYIADIVRSERPELPTTLPDFEALVARIHDDLRQERRARRWREAASNRRKRLFAALILLIPLAIGLFLIEIL